MAATRKCLHTDDEFRQAVARSLSVRQEWLGQPVPPELHHANGINNDNRLANLRLLCPNCHALTNNYRGKNQQLNKRHK